MEEVVEDVVEEVVDDVVEDVVEVVVVVVVVEEVVVVFCSLMITLLMESSTVKPVSSSLEVSRVALTSL